VTLSTKHKAAVMGVLIVERDELVGTVLADALAQGGVTAARVPDEEEAFDLPPHDAPRVMALAGIYAAPPEGSDLSGPA